MSRVVGLISGTSLDAVDVAVADLRLTVDVLELTPLGALAVPYPEPVRAGLLAALPPADCSARRLCELDTEVGLAFAEAAAQGIAELADGNADLVGSLGQTLYHWVEPEPRGGVRCLGTLQLGQPAWIAEATGLPVVSGFRPRDVAAGGQGAPLTSILDALWLADLAGGNGSTVALNLGGIANITVVDGSNEPLAYDTGPGNALLDAACRHISQGELGHDADGRIAAHGSVRLDLLDRLLADDYYAAPPPKSTGKEHFHLDHVRAAQVGLPPVDDRDLLATLTELTAVTVARECHRHDARLVVASGGGVHNAALMDRLRRQLDDCVLRTSDELGLPTDAKEAYLGALLAFLTLHGLPGNLPSATGATGRRVLGDITPGDGPLRLPPPVDKMPRALRVTVS
ncbi:anhydro-N-acetylmuramic acid kinase [Longimycelium tulufanense]|uniref:Anhydro-N-acetylmuramic acid kinase n=1 Tax=Longimycelium tulufanense TaxID=907463 RepID=A0A8J3FU33_9PSEU|nr:anhydro-N-acetylmuramic acid kinase [Longimycelium tulufanense]GGM40009.1 anhydro-N-acetylmuramic acid kinase [Longimycelium tulufanense]